MSDLKFRPRFQFEVGCDKKAFAERIKVQLRLNNPHGFLGKTRHDHFLIRVNPEKKHFWSPTLDITWEINENNKVQVRCLVAPEAAVWTMFMFLYVVAGFGAIIGLMIGSSQLTLETEPWGFWLAAGSMLLGIILFFVAQFGKDLAKEEMKELKAFIMNVCDK
ncbi:MAG: hypothetical protein RIC95_00395 [Vicingaceae bacterium]